MKKEISHLIMLLLIVSMLAAGCGKTELAQTEKGSEGLQSEQGNGERKAEDADIITLTSEMVSLEDGFSAVKYTGDYKLAQFLEQGGASSDADVMKFLTKHLFSGKSVFWKYVWVQYLICSGCRWELSFWKEFRLEYLWCLGCQCGTGGRVCLHLYSKYGFYSGGGRDGTGTPAG